MMNQPFSVRLPSPPDGKGIRARQTPAKGTFAKGADASSLDVSALDAETGEFEGYASIFGLMDLGHDVVLPGAFRTSLLERGTGGIRLLWQHDPHQPLGRWDEICEDTRGLYVRGALDLGQPKAREAFALMSRGALDGLSIGYRTQVERKDPATGLRALEKIDLWEISLVTFPLLPQARIHGLRKRPPNRLAFTGRRSPAA